MNVNQDASSISRSMHKVLDKGPIKGYEESVLRINIATIIAATGRRNTSLMVRNELFSVLYWMLNDTSYITS